MSNINIFAGTPTERQFGYLHIDHSSSPGLPVETARYAGYVPEDVSEGAVMELPTLGCVHCGAHVVVNPWRQRPRARCFKCGNAYICDACAAAEKAGCEHRTIAQLCDLVDSGRWQLAGTMSRPIILPAMR